MIQEIRIHNFGCISHASVWMTPFHAFAGPNGAGKSTLLDAIQLVSDVPRMRMQDRVWHSVGIKPATLLAQTRQDPQAYVRIVVSLLPQGPFVHEVVHQGQRAALDTIRFDSARWAHEGCGIRHHHGGSMLEAFDNLFSLAAPGRTVLIEHPENYLYPGAIREVMERLRRLAERAQVLITTHSPLVLNEMASDEVTLVQRDSDAGGSIFTPIASTPNFGERSKVYALGELWVSYLNKIYQEKP